jgi:Zn-dependent protease with chaperone function
VRDGTPDDVEHPDQRRYDDAQATYDERCRPQESADVVVDNTDLARPVLVRPEAPADRPPRSPDVGHTGAMSTSDESRPVRPRVPLPGISSRAWEHPADRGALVALRKLKGFDTVIKAMSGLVNERAVRLLFLGSAIRVDERQFPGLRRSLTEVGAVLDAETLPELYVQANPGFNAMTIGMDKPVIVVDSGLVDLLDEEELRFVVGHELGHALSGHAVYRTLLQRMLAFGGLLSAVPLGGLGIRMILAALMEWQRKSELSADRAGLLATQDPSVAFRTMMKLASGGHLDNLDQTSFFTQGAEYDAATDLRDSVLKLLLIERRSHPMPVSRAAELRKWVDSGAYTAVLGGAYPRRDEDDQAKVSDAAQEAAASYTDTFRDTQDTLGRLMHDAAGWMGAAKGWLDEQLRRRNGDE